MGTSGDTKPGKRIGIMGGTFDPIHISHLILGEKTYEQFHLDKVFFMPSGNPPHKRHREGRATDEQRAEMVRLAVTDNPHFELSLMEMHAEGYTYSYLTLEKLVAENPDTEYYFIIGADSLFSFDTWMKPDRICKCCKLVVAVRDHASDEALSQKMAELEERYGGTFLRLDIPDMEVSSNMLRAWVADSKSLRYYVPEAVIQYIEAHNIYRLTEER